MDGGSSQQQATPLWIHSQDACSKCLSGGPPENVCCLTCLARATCARMFERQLALQLSGSPFHSCRELLRLWTSRTQPAGAAGLPSTAVLEEVAVRHVLLTMLQALAQLLAASPDQAQRIVQGEGGRYIKLLGRVCSPHNIVNIRS